MKTKYSENPEEPWLIANTSKKEQSYHTLSTRQGGLGVEYTFLFRILVQHQSAIFQLQEAGQHTCSFISPRSNTYIPSIQSHAGDQYTIASCRTLTLPFLPQVLVVGLLSARRLALHAFVPWPHADVSQLGYALQNERSKNSCSAGRSIASFWYCCLG